MVSWELVASAHDRHDLDASRKRQLPAVAIAMDDQGRHGAAMLALTDQRIWFKPELIVEDDVIGEQGMSGNRNAIKQRKDRIAENTDFNPPFRLGRIYQVDPARDALRPNVHDGLKLRNARRRVPDDLAHSAHRKIDEESMICDIGKSGPRDDLAAANRNRLSNVALPSRTHFTTSTVDELDFEPHKFRVSETRYFVSQNAESWGCTRSAGPHGRNSRRSAKTSRQASHPEQVGLQATAPAIIIQVRAALVRREPSSRQRGLCPLRPRQFLFVHQFQPRHTTNCPSKSADRPVYLENQKSLRCQSRWELRATVSLWGLG